jgi:hypothetical protein
VNQVKKTFSVVALAALLGLGVNANASTIDLFAQPAGGIHFANVGGLGPQQPFSEYMNADGSIIGDYRDLVVSATGTSAGAASTLFVENGRLQFANAPGVDGLGKVQWDGGDNNAALDPTGLGGLSLINQVGCPVGGCTFFQSAVFFADLGFSIELGVYTNADEFSLLRFSTAAVDNPFGVLSTFQFSWFDTAGLNQEVEPGFFVDIIHGAGGKADFNDVGALELQLNTGGTVAVDLTIGAVTKNGVPEPSALALAGIALLGAAVGGRRGRKLRVK